MISVVIPTLDAADGLDATLVALAGARAQGLVGEVVVADGGSRDGTPDHAAAAGARVVAAPRGRGTQLAAGSAAATRPWLLFLHADTRLAPGWEAAVRAFLAWPDAAEHAAVFRLRFDSQAPEARRVERVVAWRTRRLGLPYGDQGLLIAADLLATLGGWRDMPLMEDVDLVRRIGKRRVVVLDADAVTSARRYERDGWWARPARNLLCLALWQIGVPPRAIARLYG